MLPQSPLVRATRYSDPLSRWSIDFTWGNVSPQNTTESTSAPSVRKTLENAPNRVPKWDFLAHRPPAAGIPPLECIPQQLFQGTWRILARVPQPSGKPPPHGVFQCQAIRPLPRPPKKCPARNLRSKSTSPWFMPAGQRNTLDSNPSFPCILYNAERFIEENACS